MKLNIYFLIYITLSLSEKGNIIFLQFRQTNMLITMDVSANTSKHISYLLEIYPLLKYNIYEKLKKILHICIVDVKKI